MRHEEVLRLVAISFFASLCGIAGCFSVPMFRASWHESLDLVFLLIAIPTIAMVSFIAAFSSAALLHLALRRWHSGRIVTLIVFIVTGTLEGAAFFRNAEAPPIFLGAAVSFFSGLLYCFGPFKLWRFVHIPALHGDF